MALYHLHAHVVALNEAKRSLTTSDYKTLLFASRLPRTMTFSKGVHTKLSRGYSE